MQYKNFILNDFNLGMRLIHLLFIQCEFKVIKYVLDNCVDIDFISETGDNILHYACRYSNKKTIDYVLEKCKDHNINIFLENEAGNTPLNKLLYNSNNCEDIDELFTKLINDDTIIDPLDIKNMSQSSFNSNMVRLKAREQENAENPERVFQFQHGSIEGVRSNCPKCNNKHVSIPTWFD